MDWESYNKAVGILSQGEASSARSIIEHLMGSAQSDAETAVLLMLSANCEAHLGNIEKAMLLIERAHDLSTEDRLVRSQVELAKGALHHLNKEYELANQLYISLTREYPDLLSSSEHVDFRAELLARHGMTLVHLSNFEDAIPRLRGVLELEECSDRQRILLYLGVALASTGATDEARSQLTEALNGPDKDMSKQALEHLKAIGALQ